MRAAAEFVKSKPKDSQPLLVLADWTKDWITWQPAKEWSNLWWWAHRWNVATWRSIWLQRITCIEHQRWIRRSGIWADGIGMERGGHLFGRAIWFEHSSTTTGFNCIGGKSSRSPLS
jgi:hypothetical protein